MNLDYYSVWYGTVLLADHMSLGNALLFIEALFHKFWNESDSYVIKKEPGPVSDIGGVSENENI